MAGSSWPPRAKWPCGRPQTRLGGPGPQRMGTCVAQWDYTGVQGLGYPQAGKVLALSGSVPSVPGHGGHSQGPGAVPSGTVLGPHQGATQVAGETLACVCLSALRVPTTFQHPGLRWLPATAGTLVYYTVLISNNLSLFKRTLKTLFLTLILCKACSLCEGWGGSGTQLGARFLQALGHKGQAPGCKQQVWALTP